MAVGSNEYCLLRKKVKSPFYGIMVSMPYTKREAEDDDRVDTEGPYSGFTAEFDATIEVPANSNGETKIVRGIYDINNDPRLVIDDDMASSEKKKREKLKAFVWDRLMSHPMLGRDFDKYSPNTEDVVITLEELEELKRMKKAEAERNNRASAATK